MNKKQGSILIELMIAIILELLLLRYLLEIYVNSQQASQLQNKLIELQNSAKTAITILSSEVHQAGYVGCQRLTKHYPLIAYPPYFLSKQNSLTGTDAEITVRYMGGTNILKYTMEQENILYVDNQVNYSPREMLLISDCQHAEIFQIAQVTQQNNSQKITTVNPLRMQFYKNAEIGKLEINKFFIAKTKHKTNNGESIYALFLENIKREKFELVEGINKMFIKYLVRQNGKLLELTADHVGDWATVRGVAIELELTQFPLHKTWYVYIANANPS